ncbi:TonB-dependent receptor [Mucilaginibacter celer]|uniref:TonB-dependent receptor n=1 Tax=Mucilaginibacter celer TaxID=2305508 RepID=A0A494VQV2_9SPHI|nr:TonB-dependent receptor [Mucilaginibacter celer]AYL95680.1 TonB-dependent receptor [Mucilaginibacter celer]
MKLKIAAFFAAWLCIAQTFVKAQSNIAISGKITNTEGQALEGATIYLKTVSDSVLIKTAISGADGSYQLVQLKKGNYRLYVTMIGFAAYKSPPILLEQSIVGQAISLQKSGTALKEVIVTAQKPLIEHQVDRTVVNVDALISNAGSTAMDVLEKSPGVIVDQNGAISLKGKNGVKIFIDDKPTYLSGADLENYLRSLSASTIDQVELMTNPPAKYDAAGNGGVINIRLKKNKAKGFNGGLNLSYSQGRFGKTNNSFNFNYRNNKFNVFGNISYSTVNSFNDLDINRHFLNADGSIASNFLQNSYIRHTGQSYNSKIGVDYYASDKNTFGINLTGLINPAEDRTLNTSRLLNASDVLDSTIVAINREHSRLKNGGINLNFRHQYDKKGRELSFDLDYLVYHTVDEQSFDNTTYLPNGADINHDLLTGNLPSNIDIYSAKTDYTHPLAGGFKLAAGLKASYTKTNNIADYFYTTDGLTTPDYGKTNHFIYKENINAAYLNLNKDWKRVSLQAGLRFENTSSDGHQLGNIQKPDSVFKRNYNGLFPTLYVQYKLDTAGNQTININYGRRIDRPYYQDLNPFLSPLDKFTYYTGNPFLKPSYTNSIELSHTWKNITTTLSYSKTKDEVNETIEIVDGIYYSRPGNIGSKVIKSISVDAGFDPTKWLNIHFYGHVMNMHTISAFYTGTLNTQGTYYFIRPVFQFKIPQNWTLQLDGGYQSSVTDAQFVTRGMGKINTAVSKKISASTTLKLVVNDVFRNFISGGDINNLANTQANYRNIRDSRTTVLSLSYRFGKAMADQRKHNSNGAESEQNRVKN